MTPLLPAPSSEAFRPRPRRSLGVGVIGCGYWGTNLVRNFSALPEARLRALADLSLERRATMAAQYPEVDVLADHRLLLSRPDIQAVAICTPPATHAALAVEALDAGKHVLVEKPLATSVAEVDAMIAAAARADRTLMVGHTFEYNPAVELLASLVHQGVLGRIYYLRATRVNLGLFQKNVDVLWDLAPHDLSILATVLGQQPERLRAWGQAFVHPQLVDVASLNLGYAGGLTALTHVSWLDPCKIRRVTVVGDEKMAVYDDLEPLDKIKIYDCGVEKPPYADSFGEFQLSYRYGDVHAPRLRWVEPLRLQCAHFIACALDGSPPRSGGLSGRQVVALLEAADRSLSAGGAEIQLARAP